jgi:hypothetical protein
MAAIKKRRDTDSLTPWPRVMYSQKAIFHRQGYQEILFKNQWVLFVSWRLGGEFWIFCETIKGARRKITETQDRPDPLVVVVAPEGKGEQKGSERKL